MLRMEIKENQENVSDSMRFYAKMENRFIPVFPVR